MKIRIFGSDVCEDCLEVFILIKKFKVDFEYIDAFDDDDKIQDICDENDVDELPHLQFINNKNEIIIEHIGPLDEDKFINYLGDYL